MSLPDNLKNSVEYDRENGGLLWKKPPKRKSQLIGRRVGNYDKDGYRRFCFKKKMYRVARVVWFIHNGKWPENLIDHINRVKDDDRIENLREADHKQNAANKFAKSNTRHGYKGISYHKRDRKWQALIEADGKSKFLGYFQTPEDAHFAYCKEAKRRHGEFFTSGANK